MSLFTCIARAPPRTRVNSDSSCDGCGVGASHTEGVNTGMWGAASAIWGDGSPAEASPVAYTGDATTGDATSGATTGATSDATSGATGCATGRVAASRESILFARNSIVLRMLWRSALVGASGDGMADAAVIAEHDSDIVEAADEDVDARLP